MQRGLGRFSFFGMQTLLILYMVDQLLLPEHVEQIAGVFGAFRSSLEWVVGPLSTQSLAAMSAAPPSQRSAWSRRCFPGVDGAIRCARYRQPTPRN